MTIKLTIIIPVFNNWSFTKAALKDLSELPDDHEIIVVDNGSTDDTAAMLTTIFFDGSGGPVLPINFRYIKNDANYGFGKACNKGAAISKGKYVMFLNNDVRVQGNYKTWTQPLIAAAKNDIINGYGAIVGPTMGQLDNNLNFIKEANANLDGNSYMSGWCIIASKETWKKLDLSNNEIFSEDFFCYFEDADLCFRAKQAGIPMQVVPVPVIHFGKITSKKLNTSELYLKARTIFINKWASKIS